MKEISPQQFGNTLTLLVQIAANMADKYPADQDLAHQLVILQGFQTRGLEHRRVVDILTRQLLDELDSRLTENANDDEWHTYMGHRVVTQIIQKYMLRFEHESLWARIKRCFQLLRTCK